MTEDKNTTDVTQETEEITNTPLDQVKEEIFINPTGKIIENLRTSNHEDVTFLNQDYGDCADLIISASTGREFVETLYGQEIADKLWGTHQS